MNAILLSESEEVVIAILSLESEEERMKENVKTNLTKIGVALKNANLLYLFLFHNYFCCFPKVLHTHTHTHTLLKLIYLNITRNM